MDRTVYSLVVFILALFATLVCAAVSVRIEEWSIPSTDRFPRDPAVAPDGALWYTGMGSNTLGRLDLKNGQFRSYPLKTPDSGPHGLVADQDGTIWFTANYKGYIGRLDPKSGAVTEFPLPDKAARDPHTLVFDAKGLLWFTVQQDNFVGRLEPSTGKIVLKRPPTTDARPYGIAVSSNGIPFFCEFGSDRIGSIDPATLAITEYALPKGARPRRIAITADDMIWYTDYQRGYLGRLDPRTGRVEEWPSPGGKKAAPYGMTATPDGVVWYSESGVKPNTMVRFDPRTKKFETWPVPSGGVVIRHMAATPQGDIYIACSGVSKVGVVRVIGELKRIYPTTPSAQTFPPCLSMIRRTVGRRRTGWKSDPSTPCRSPSRYHVQRRPSGRTGNLPISLDVTYGEACEDLNSSAVRTSTLLDLPSGLICNSEIAIILSESHALVKTSRGTAWGSYLGPTNRAFFKYSTALSLLDQTGRENPASSISMA